MEHVKPRVRVFTRSIELWYKENQDKPLMKKWHTDNSLNDHFVQTNTQKNYFYNYRES